MPSIYDDDNRARDGAFQALVRSGAVRQARAVFREDAATTNHAKRLAFAIKVVASPDGRLASIAHVVAVNPTVRAIAPTPVPGCDRADFTVTDGVLASALAAEWDLLSE